MQEARVPQLGLTPFPFFECPEEVCVYTPVHVCVWVCACVHIPDIGLCPFLTGKEGHGAVTAYQGIVLVQIMSISYIGPKCRRWLRLPEPLPGALGLGEPKQ